MVNLNKDAIAHLEKSLTINSAYLPSLFLLCELYIDSKQLDLAKVYLDKIKNINCQDSKFLLLCSKLAFEEENFSKAKAYIDICLKNKCFEKEVLILGLKLASILKINKDKVFILENWLLHHEPSTENYLELAKSLDQPNQYDKAKYYFKLARELSPNDENVLLESAKFHCSAKLELNDGSIVSKADFTEAKRILKQILTFNKESLGAICMLGEIHFKEDDYLLAKKYFEFCYESNFHKANFLLELAKIAKIYSTEEAHEKYLNEAAVHKTLRAEALFALCKAKVSQEKPDEAIVQGLEAIKAYRRKTRMLKIEINKNLNFNNFAYSKTLVQDAKCASISTAELYFVIHDLKRDIIWRRKCIEKALEFNPCHPDANFEKALLIERTDSNKSLKYLKICIDNSWFHWRARWQFIKINKNMPKEEIISFLEIILEMNPKHKKAMLELNRLGESESKEKEG